MDSRWTIRNVSEEARIMIDEVHEATGIPYGRLLTLAIQRWHAQLPEDRPILRLMESWNNRPPAAPSLQP